MPTWAFKPGPGAHTCAFWCNDKDEFDRLAQQAEDGELTVDGNIVACVDLTASTREDLFLRLTFAGPYVPPPLILNFEDVTVATRIGETGWYTFEGGLYRAEHLGDGRVALDRVYAAEPSQQWHGQALAGIETLDRDPERK